jgi:PAS domain S-box-containing protein
MMPELPAPAELAAENERLAALLRRTEESLAAARKEAGELRAALDEHAIVAITDAHGKINFVNDKFCTISKYAREELIGQDHRIINSGHHSQEFIRDLWTTIARGQVWHGELKNRARDGSFYWVDTTIVPFLNAAGKPYQYVAIRADITERKKAQEALHLANESLEAKVIERTIELQAAKERAEEGARIKSQFLANMSHELRTPLNGIMGFSEFLADGKPGPLNGKQKEYLGDILNSGRHLLELINDLLDLAKIEAGKMELNLQPFSLSDAIQQVCAGANPMARAKKMDVQLTLDPGITTVTLDQHKFKQVIYNLLSNAVKFTGEGGRVEIVVQLRAPGRFVVSVRDTGIGIRADDLPRLFTEFEQLDSGADRRFDGTGLGLALTRKLVELQDGSIFVESEVGQGSSFSVTLPLALKFNEALQ